MSSTSTTPSRSSVSVAPSEPGSQYSEGVSFLDSSFRCSGRLERMLQGLIWAYSQNNDEGLLRLVQLISDATGGEGSVPPEMIENDVSPHIANFLRDYYNYSRGGKYPIENPVVCENLRSFFELLVKVYEKDVLYDRYMFPKLLDFLAILSQSRVIVFRHTATLIVLRMLTASLEVLEKCKEALACAVALESNTNDEDLSDQRENLIILQTLIKRMFSIVKRRFSDAIPAIRCLCLEEMAFWIGDKQHLLKEQGTLKLLGLCLTDSEAEVRQMALKVVINLINTSEDTSLSTVQAASRFVYYFSRQIYTLTLEEDVGNAVLAIRVVTLICRNMPDSVSESLYQDQFLFAYSKYSALAVAIAPFVKTLVTRNAENNLQYFRNLASYSAKTIGGEHMIVDVLREASADWIKDFDSMILLLLRESEEGMPAEMSDLEELTLVHIFCISVKWLATGQPPERIFFRGLPPQKTGEIREDFQTPNSIKVAYPKLVDKFRLDDEKVISLVRLLPYLNLQADFPNNSEVVDPLFKNLDTVFHSSNSITVLKEISHWACYYCQIVKADFNVNLRTFILTPFSEPAFIDVMRKLLEWFSMDETEGLQEDSLTADIVNDFKKLFAITYYDYSMVERTEVWVVIKMFLNKYANSDYPLQMELFEYAANAYCRKLAWDLKLLAGEDKKISENELKEEINIFVTILLSKFGVGHTEYEISVYAIVCEALVLMKSFGVPKRIAERFQITTKAVLEDKFFSKDEDGNFLYGTQDQRREVFAAFVSSVGIHGVIPVECTPAIFQHYIENRKEFGKPFEILVRESKKKDEEACLYVILTSLSTSYFTHDSSQDELTTMANALTELFGSSREKKTALRFHQFAILLCVQHLEHNEPFNFVEVISGFIKRLRPSSFEEVSTYLRTTVGTGTARTSTRRNIATHIDKYMQSVSPYLPVRQRRTQADNDESVGSVNRKKHSGEDRGRKSATRSVQSKRGRGSFGQRSS